MINLKSVTIRNFMSFGQKPTTFDLDFEGLRLILGENRDNDGDGTSNGTGKTQAVQSIIYALFGRGTDKMKSDDMVNVINGKGMLVELEFSLNDEAYLIKRGRKPNVLEFYKGDESLTLDSMKNTEELINKTVGIDFDVFMTAFYLSPYKESFMAMSPADQRSLFETILSLDTLTERAEQLKLLRKEIETEIKIIDRDLENADQTNSKINRYVSDVEQEKEQFIKEHDKKIKENKEQLEVLEDVGLEMIESTFEFEKETNDKLTQTIELIEDTQVQISELDNRIYKKEVSLKTEKEKKNNNLKVLELYNTHSETINKQIEDIQQKLKGYLKGESQYVEEIDEYERNEKNKDRLLVFADQIDRMDQQRSTVSSSLEEKQQFLKELESSVCPTCGQDHQFDTSKLDETKTEIKKLEEDLQSIESELSEINNACEEILDQFDENVLEKDIDNLRKELSSLKELEAELSRKQEEAKTNPYESQIEGMERIEDIEESISSLEASISQMKSDKEKKESELISLEEERDTTMKKHTETLETIDMLKGIGISSPSDYTKQVDSLKKEIEDQADLSSFDKKIESMKKDLVDVDQLQEQKNELNSDFEHSKYLIRLLTDSKGFIRKNIVNQYIPYVNKKILEYTEFLGLRHVISINSDLTSSINIMGKEVSYWNLSQGERLRVNLSVTIAFRELLKLLGKSCNIIIADEQLDGGSDEQMVRQGLKFIDQHSKGSLIVSHKQEVLEYIDDRINLVKENGFTRVV